MSWFISAGCWLLCYCASELLSCYAEQSHYAVMFVERASERAERASLFLSERLSASQPPELLVSRATAERASSRLLRERAVTSERAYCYVFLFILGITGQPSRIV
jgi:hypothetical protein